MFLAKHFIPLVISTLLIAFSWQRSAAESPHVLQSKGQEEKSTHTAKVPPALSKRSIFGVVVVYEGFCSCYKKLPGVDLRVIGVGGGPTSLSGEYNISLPPEFEAGSEINFSISDSTGYTIESPHDGRIWLPKDRTVSIPIILKPGPTHDQRRAQRSWLPQTAKSTAQKKP